MTVLKTFAAESKAVPLVFPKKNVRGEDIVFRLLPRDHSDVAPVVRKNVSLEILEKIEEFNASPPGTKPSKYFKNMAELDAWTTATLAAHIEGWSNLLGDEEEIIPFSYAQAFEYLSDPAYRGLYIWIEEQVNALGDTQEVADEKTVAIKKNSATRSASKSSGVKQPPATTPPAEQ